ncbi:MAG: dTDP-4-dehydrorhamnose 3,5-epimerase [bacterium]
MNVYRTSLDGVLLIEPHVFMDSRGIFLETYQQKRYEEAGIGVGKPFVQDNHSHSVRGALRGLHYQLLHPQGKLVWVVCGTIFDVAVDIRRNSPTFGKWLGIHLSAGDHRQIFIPEGFAHGFCVLSEQADVIYKCTDFYVPGDEYGIRWDDPDLAIGWPVRNPILSEKDAHHPFLSQQREECFPLLKNGCSG